MKQWMKNVRAVEPYVPGEQPQVRDVTKLNTNENPYPPAPGVLAAISAVDEDRLRRYPDPDCRGLIRALADYYHVGEDQVFVGVGSDDVLATAFMTFFNGNDPILFPDISYAFYEVWAEMMRIPYRKIPLGEDFRLKAEDYVQPNGGIVFPNPNAPTSILEPVSFVEKIAAANPGSVVIADEAYIDFGGESALPLIQKYDNLLVTQTFSKSRALAGMRIGFAIGDPALISAMMAVRNSYNSYTMNQTALDAGIAAIEDDEYFRGRLADIMDTRADAVKRLGALGFSGPKPMANFLFVQHENVPAAKIFEALRARHIFVRYFAKPRIDNYLRISVGTPAQMERLYAALEEIIRENR
ncbi:MAG: histidinol-phosphate transaminase [Lachnospiraceae bacterium]|nr:histidinol-phosphate transaminase [Lachnospiraceae bacterium]